MNVQILFWQDFWYCSWTVLCHLNIWQEHLHNVIQRQSSVKEYGFGSIIRRMFCMWDNRVPPTGSCCFLLNEGLWLTRSLKIYEEGIAALTGLNMSNFPHLESSNDHTVLFDCCGCSRNALNYLRTKLILSRQSNRCWGGVSGLL